MWVNNMWEKQLPNRYNSPKFQLNQFQYSLKIQPFKDLFRKKNWHIKPIVFN